MLVTTVVTPFPYFVPMLDTGIKTVTISASFHDRTNRYKKPPRAVAACRTLSSRTQQPARATSALEYQTHHTIHWCPFATTGATVAASTLLQSATRIFLGQVPTGIADAPIARYTAATTPTHHMDKSLVTASFKMTVSADRRLMSSPVREPSKNATSWLTSDRNSRHRIFATTCSPANANRYARPKLKIAPNIVTAASAWCVGGARTGTQEQTSAPLRAVL